MSSQNFSEIENKAHELEVSMARFISGNNSLSLNQDISLADLIDIEDLKEIMIPFYQATGLGVGVFDQNNRMLASAGWQKICTHFHEKNPVSHRSCKESENYFKKHFEPNKAISYKCNNGLWDVAYPIYIDDEFYGSIYFGQFFYSDDVIEKEFFLSQAEKFNFEPEAYINELKEVPILEKSKVDSDVKLFLKIVEKMAKSGRLQTDVI